AGLAALQLRLALPGLLLVELGLGLGALRPFLGDRGLAAALLGAMLMVADVVALGLVLHPPEFPALGGAAGDGGEDREDDHCSDDDGDDRNRGHLNSFVC